MEIFTYQDYLKYQKFLQEEGKQVIQNVLCEDEEVYKAHSKLVKNEHDKIFRRILDDKKEASKFINKTLKLRVPVFYTQERRNGM